MKELSDFDIETISGSGGESAAQLAGALAGTWLSGGNPYVGALGGYAAGEIYDGIKNGYETAPPITEGLRSYNPNYNPGLIGGGWSGGGMSSQCFYDKDFVMGNPLECAGM
ncbi:hypothetical protein [Erwinia sp. S38]|uniref:hypothetical protein n=1 Tax=Erwinia sp. S38 TaxID=2769338 RepID=UPI00190A5031|nr:hypothetical protein [Erwinia sp. S38]MBK0004850.1 hypothetical protein [Erwinia sp. S38]